MVPVQQLRQLWLKTKWLASFLLVTGAAHFTLELVWIYSERPEDYHLHIYPCGLILSVLVAIVAVIQLYNGICMRTLVNSSSDEMLAYPAGRLFVNLVLGCLTIFLTFLLAVASSFIWARLNGYKGIQCFVLLLENILSVSMTVVTAQCSDTLKPMENIYGKIINKNSNGHPKNRMEEKKVGEAPIVKKQVNQDSQGTKQNSAKLMNNKGDNKTGTHMVRVLPDLPTAPPRRDVVYEAVPEGKVEISSSNVINNLNYKAPA